MHVGASSAVEHQIVSRRSLTRRLDYDVDLPADLANWLWHEDMDRLLAASRPEQIKDRCAAVRFDHSQGPYLLKRHTWGRWTRTARMLLREPSSRSSFTIGVELANAGVATPRPRASVEYCFGPFGYRSYLLTDYVQGTTLFRFIRSGAGTPDMLTQLARQVAEIWQRLIELNVSHNDLKPENFIVDPSHRVWLIDFEKFHRHSSVNRWSQLRQRHLDDLKRFLQVRTWRTQPEAAEAFRRALVENTQLGQWLWDSAPPGHPGTCRGYSPDELASGLSVLIVSRDPRDERGVSLSVSSVVDIADEILLVASSAREGFDVLRQFPTLADAEPARARSVFAERIGLRIKPTFPQQPWVLVLYPGERVTPELARRLPEQIVERKDFDAYRIPVSGGILPQQPRHRARGDTAPIRLLHQGRCSFALRGGELLVSVDPTRIGQFVERLHDTAPGVALRRAA